MKKSLERKNPFSASQDEAVNARVKLVETQLEVLKSRKIKVEKITHLAEIVAAQISDIQESPCSATTLLRNHKYKVLLKRFFNESGYLTTGGNSNGLEEMPLSVRLELSNLRSEVDRLKKYISYLEVSGGVEGIPKTHQLRENPAETNSESSLRDLKIAFAQSCQIVQRLLSYWHEYMEIDSKSGEIVDRQFSRGDRRRVIVQAQATTSYVEWQKNLKFDSLNNGACQNVILL